MAKPDRRLWARLRISLLANPGRFAGGAAVTDPLALLAAEQERLATLRRSGDQARPIAIGGGSGNEV